MQNIIETTIGRYPQKNREQADRLNVPSSHIMLSVTDIAGLSNMANVLLLVAGRRAFHPDIMVMIKITMLF